MNRRCNSEMLEQSEILSESWKCIRHSQCADQFTQNENRVRKLGQASGQASFYYGANKWIKGEIPARNVIHIYLVGNLLI